MPVSDGRKKIWIVRLTEKNAVDSLLDMNAAHLSKSFGLPATPAATCGDPLCFACLHGVCDAARAAERAEMERCAPELAPLSDAEIAAIGDVLDAETFTLIAEAA